MRSSGTYQKGAAERGQNAKRENKRVRKIKDSIQNQTESYEGGRSRNRQATIYYRCVYKKGRERTARSSRGLVPAISDDLTGVEATTRQFAEQFVLVLAHRFGQRPNRFGDVLRVVLL